METAGHDTIAGLITPPESPTKPSAQGDVQANHEDSRATQSKTSQEPFKPASLPQQLTTPVPVPNFSRSLVKDKSFWQSKGSGSSQHASAKNDIDSSPSEPSLTHNDPITMNSQRWPADLMEPGTYAFKPMTKDGKSRFFPSTKSPATTSGLLRASTDSSNTLHQPDTLAHQGPPIDDPRSWGKSPDTPVILQEDVKAMETGEADSNATSVGQAEQIADEGYFSDTSNGSGDQALQHGGTEGNAEADAAWEGVDEGFWKV